MGPGTAAALNVALVKAVTVVMINAPAVVGKLDEGLIRAWPLIGPIGVERS